MFNGTGRWLGQTRGSRNSLHVSLVQPAGNRAQGVRLSPVPATVSSRPASRAEPCRAKAFESASPMAGIGNPPTATLAGRGCRIRLRRRPEDGHRFKTAGHARMAQGRQQLDRSALQRVGEAPGAFLFGRCSRRPSFDGHQQRWTWTQGLDRVPRLRQHAYLPNEAWSETMFGVVSGAGIPDPGSKRHEFSNDMVGRCLTWSYSPGLPRCTSARRPTPSRGSSSRPTGHAGTSWAGPGEFVKIRDGLYFQYWREDACNGTLGTILVNMRTMHDAGHRHSLRQARRAR